VSNILDRHIGGRSGVRRIDETGDEIRVRRENDAKGIGIANDTGEARLRHVPGLLLLLVTGIRGWEGVE
jgi:hypothetical protein